MYETLLALLAAHFLSDFVLQRDWMVANKRKWWVLALHGLLVGFATAATLGARDLTAAMAVATVVFTHLIIDAVKVRVGDTMLSFAIDQLAHILVAIAIAVSLPTLAGTGAWSLLPGDAQSRYYAVLVLGSGLIVTVPMGGIIIKKAIRPFDPSRTQASIIPAAAAPLNAGRYIGWLERGLTFAFILMKMPEGVGFLLAAKSVLRIGDLKEQGDRSHAEYIIIGTFMSFGWAFLFAILTQTILAHWSGDASSLAGLAP